MTQSHAFRSLLAVPSTPWPPHSGGRQRMLQFALVLREFGPFDLVIVDSPDGMPGTVESISVPGEQVFPTPDRAFRYSARHRSSGLRQQFAWLLSRKPMEFWERDFEPLAGTLASLLDNHYDVVVLYDALVALVILPLLPDGPRTILDLPDLYDVRLRRTAASDPGAGLRSRLSAVRAKLAARRWRTAQARTARAVDVVTVCSEDDARQVDQPNVLVVRNGYEPMGAAPRPTDPARSAPHPVLLFQGSMRYEPNTDAVAYFLEFIHPLIRRAKPDAVFRVAGRASERLQPLANRPGIEVVGEVDDMAVQVREADVCVVPLRAGSGTRIKVLEAFALGVPVVATSIAVEGLEVEAGRHCLVEDRPESFAAAVVQLLDDEVSAASLVREARRLYEARYQWSSVRDDLREVIAALTEIDKPAPGHAETRGP